MIAYLDNELSARKQNAIQSHLSHCPICTAELESYKKLNGIIEQLPKVEDRSPLFWQNQVKAIEQKVTAVQTGKKPEPNVQVQWHKPAWYKYAAATVTVSVVAIVFVLNQNHQPVSSIVAIERKPTPVIAVAKPETTEKKDVDKKVDRLRMIQPAAPILPSTAAKDSDYFAAAKSEKAIPDKIEEKPKSTVLFDMNGDMSGEITTERMAKTPAVPAPAPIAESKKAAKSFDYKAKGISGYTYSNIPTEKRLKTLLDTPVNTQDNKAALRINESAELARGTSLNNMFQQVGQSACFGYGTMTQSMQAVPASMRAGDELNLAFDSAAKKMMQNTMEMMVQTQFPNQQNQRVIEIKEIPQPAASSPRHIQIKMDFQP